jgi:sialic acid synthase SpsE
MKTFIIAELGINHDGSFDKCIKLIREAKKSGANSAKVQIIDPNSSYQKKTKSYKEFLNKILTIEELFKIKKFADEIKIDFFATIGDLASLELVKKLFIKKIKISSGLITNIPLIEEISKNKLELIISTGMAFKKEIMEAINVASKYLPKNKISLLKCTSLYPAPDYLLNLTQILLMKKKFSIKIGYSDHSLDDLPVIAAVSLGAEIIEKHFTLNNKLLDADHKISYEPYQFKKMVDSIRRVEDSMGNSKIIYPSHEEIKLRKLRHRYLVTINQIKKNDIFTYKNLGFKRLYKESKKAIKAKFYKSFIGKKSKVNIDQDIVVNKNFLK